MADEGGGADVSGRAVVPALVRTRLSVMMFLQFAIWGAWLPILYPFLLGHRGFGLDQVGAILAGGAAGAIVGPFIAGQVADRYFPTERFLGVSHLFGAVLVWALSGIDEFWMFFGISVLYGVVYAPTLALTNSISFHHLPDRDKDFGKVRVWGTLGWIVAGIAVGQWLLRNYTPGITLDQAMAMLSAADLRAQGLSEAQIAEAAEATRTAVIEAKQNEGRADAFKLSSILGVMMAIYCFTLPHTPPAREAKQASATSRGIKQILKQPLLALFVISVPVSVIHQFYFVHAADFLTGIQNAAGASSAAKELADSINVAFGVGGGGLMTIGQMVEIGVIALMPLIATRLGRKTLLCAGLVAYALRMVLFAFVEQISGATGIAPVAVAIAGVSLHGFCFGCFIFVAFMVVDEQTTPDVRATAQNLYNLVFVGIGIIVGSWFATSVVGSWATEPVLVDGTPQLDGDGKAVTAMNYTKLFVVPAIMAVVCLLAMLVVYPSKVKRVEP